MTEKKMDKKLRWELRHGIILDRDTEAVLKDYKKPLLKTENYGYYGTVAFNPEHLEDVSHKDNIAHGVYPKKTHCIRGHKFEEGSYWSFETPYGTQHRSCKACHKIRQRKKYNYVKGKE